MLVVSAVVATSLVVGAVAIQGFGVSDRSSPDWNRGILPIVRYGLIGARTLIQGVVILVIAAWVFIFVRAVVEFFLRLPWTIGEWIDTQGVRGLLGLGLYAAMYGVVGLGIFWLAGGLDAITGFWASAAVMFVIWLVIGGLTGGLLTGVVLVAARAWTPNHIRDRHLDDSPTANALIMAGTVVASFALWRYFWDDELATAAQEIPRSVVSTPLGSYLMLATSGLVVYLGYRSVRVFTDRHRLLPKFARKPVWSHTATVDAEPVGDTYWTNEPVAGWRVWDWNSTDLVGVMTSWRTPSQTAVCVRPAPCESPPGWDCNCGIYAFKDADDLPWNGRMREVIWGRVGLTGRVVEHDTGYRAAGATIQRLWILDKGYGDKAALAESLRRKYPDVKVSVVEHDVRRAMGASRLAVLEINV